MKKIIFISIIISITSLILISGCTPQESKVGVLNMEKVLNESKRAEQLRDELSEIGTNLEKEYEEKEKDLESDSKEEELDKIYQQFLQNKENLEGELNKEVSKVLETIAQEKNLDVVLLKQYVQFGGQDVTEETIKELDEKYYQE